TSFSSTSVRTRASLRRLQNPSRSTTCKPLSYLTFLTTPAHHTTSVSGSLVRRKPNARACWYGTRPGKAGNAAVALVQAPRPLEVAAGATACGVASGSRTGARSPPPSPRMVVARGVTTCRSRPSHSGMTHPLPVTPGWPGSGGASTLGPCASSTSTTATRAWYVLLLPPYVRSSFTGAGASRAPTRFATTTVPTGKPRLLACPSTSHSSGGGLATTSGSGMAGAGSPSVTPP